jgi:hypothetical protein
MRPMIIVSLLDSSSSWHSDAATEDVFFACCCCADLEVCSSDAFEAVLELLASNAVSTRVAVSRALSFRSLKSGMSTELMWADRRWYIDGSRRAQQRRQN